MNSFADITVEQLRRALVIKEQITGLEAELALILNEASPAGRTARGRGRRSAATRARMAAAQKARWANRGGRRGLAPAKKRRRKMNAAWRAKLAAAARARWKSAKAAGRTKL